MTAIGSNALSRPAPISPDDAKRLTADFQIVPSTAPSAAATAAVQQATRQAELDAQALLSAQSADTGTLSGDRSISGTGSTGVGSSLAVGLTTPVVNSGVGVSVGSGTGSQPLLSVGAGTSGSGVGVTLGVKLPLPILPAVGASVGVGTPLLRK